MDHLTWDRVRSEFAFDGSLRDIYILQTHPNDWQQILNALRAGAFELQYFRDAQPAELPFEAAEIFGAGGERSCLLSVTFDGITANCHFFMPSEIEFDIDPREVRGEQQFDALIRFMHLLAETTSKEALLTVENTPSMVILRVRSGQAEVEYIPSPNY
jgi:hypothetical protein